MVGVEEYCDGGEKSPFQGALDLNARDPWVDVTGQE